MEATHVSRDPEIMSGAVCFKGSRVPVQNLFDYLEGASTLDEFLEDFPPDEKFNYRRDQNPIPERFIRAYQLRDPKTGRDGPWLAGMTLDPAIVHEAWCHQRGYICFIEEFGGRRVKPGECFCAAFVVGYFESVEEMNRVYDQYKGHTALDVTSQGWKLRK